MDFFVNFFSFEFSEIKNISTFECILNSNNARVFFWTPAFRQKEVLWFHHWRYVSVSVCQYVSVSVGKHVFSETTQRIFLKLLMKLECLKTDRAGLFGKNLFGDNALKHPRNTVFWILQKNSLLMCRFFGFKSCTIMTFMILLTPHAWPIRLQDF